MEVFKVIYETESDGDLYGISIVDDPANGFDFIAMNKKMEIKLATDQKKKILYGIVLRPEQKIYREFEDGTPFQLMFDGPTIERFSQDFMTKGYQKNTTFNHDGGNLGGTTVVENWIVTDKTNDKGNSIGLPVENGDWVIGMKLSDQLWSEYIETGKAKGFSIDSFVQFEKINMKKTCEDYLTQDLELNSRENNKEKQMSIMKKLIKLFSEGEVSLASLDTDLGTLTADAFEVGNIVYDANLQPVVSQEFTVDNKVYQTDETGSIVEVSDVAEDLIPEEAPVDAEAVVLEDVAPEVATDVEGVTKSIVDEVAKQVEDIDVDALKALVAQLQADLEKLTAQQDAVLMENVELKKMAASTKIKAEGKVGTNNPINLKAKELSTEDTLSALSRIIKKNNK